MGCPNPANATKEAKVRAPLGKGKKAAAIVRLFCLMGTTAEALMVVTSRSLTAVRAKRDRVRDDSGCYGLVRDDFDAEAAGAGAVEFAEKDSLPTAELESAFGDEDGGGSAYERGLNVGVGVAFGVAVAGGLGNEAREGGFDIGGDVGVGVFVDHDAGGGVRDVKVADAGVHGGV